MVSRIVSLAAARAAVTALGLLTLGACATAPPAPPMARPPGDAAPVPPARPRPPEGGAEPAVLALVHSAESMAARGQWDAAAAEIERALRLQPRNPRLWQRLAELRLAQDRPRQAEDLALKSNDLAGDDPELRRYNWRIVALARRMRGDTAGAQAALARAEAEGR